MKDISRKLMKFYGNRGLSFDIVIAILITVVIYSINLQINIQSFERDVYFSIIDYLGVLAGFLLTAFSLLYIYNPTESKALESLRKSTIFSNMLKVFLTTIGLVLLSTAIIYLKIVIALNYNQLIILIITLSILRIIKCLYYLYAIVDMSHRRNSSSNTN